MYTELEGSDETEARSRQRARSRKATRDPADLLEETKSRTKSEINLTEVKVYDNDDMSGKLEVWNGITLIDLEQGIPDYFGESDITDYKDLVGAFSCKQMALELNMQCGVLIRHLDVPYIEMRGQVAVVLQMLDVSSDVFFIIDLLRVPMYAVVDYWVKFAYYTLFALSQLLWISMAFFKAWRRWQTDCDKIMKSKEMLGANLTWDLKGKWLLGAFWENLFPSPVTVLSGRRVVKRVPLGGQAVTIAGYASAAGFKFRYNRGAQSLWPTLLLEDLPLLCIQAYIYYCVGKVGPVFVINSTFSFISAAHKGSILYEQNKHREIYRNEILEKIAEATEDAGGTALKDNAQFWKNVYADEFGGAP